MPDSSIEPAIFRSPEGALPTEPALFCAGKLRRQIHFPRTSPGRNSEAVHLSSSERRLTRTHQQYPTTQSISGVEIEVTVLSQILLKASCWEFHGRLTSCSNLKKPASYNNNTNALAQAVGVISPSSFYSGIQSDNMSIGVFTISY